ncbi:progestin and adipoQ receptor family member 4 [Thecamonas trahens ATCC 50062]|uniref:Progestin and adipoQ receptor family member 4 n=1 Tax=Thecamonas trahens ATCC 50062 TaxID=461836 RepID=A0A0L0D6R5_THETB|nr:progestin and adipoQ receptor family member 4 [Thecamonas trahens ATCC 50062]KNC47781.1 progestin and adipoQ receptor family member 4 [Thecamonas trahens ATCC 50062]|eukprot:XP_013759259.1 progestin and adipoQ receptor family member 4 [Thecamonas trahens ATCC 50062]
MAPRTRSRSRKGEESSGAAGAGLAGGSGGGVDGQRAGAAAREAGTAEKEKVVAGKFQLFPPPPVGHVVSEIVSPTYELVEYGEAPAVLQYNKFVETGYRAHLSTAQALASFWHLHNESMNVWTHGGGFVFFLVLFIQGWTSFGFVDPIEYLLWTCQTSSALICFFFSVSYHLFQCHGECSLTSYKAWLSYDLWGILYAYVASSIRRVFYALHCYPRLRNLCLIVTLVFAAGVLVTAVTGALLASPKMRVAIFGALMVAANLSTVFSLYLSAGSAEARQLHILAIVLQVVGGTINATRMPERILPSWIRRSFTDYYFNSHAIMHVVVGTSVYCTWIGCNADWQWAMHSDAPCAGVV